MPRLTRAALRSIEQQDESDIAALTPLPHTPKGRVPLGEVAGNKDTHNEASNTVENRVAPTKKGTGKAKNKQAAQKDDKQMMQTASAVLVEVLEDENQSTHSSAAEEASKDLLKVGSQGTQEAVIDRDRPLTPPSSAAVTASRQLSPRLTTPRFDSEIPNPDDMTMTESKEEKEDSFVAKIESRTPLKVATREKTDIQATEDGEKDDSFVEQIKTRTPGKCVSRIEDSVDALDLLDEEIEKVDGLIPASNAGLQPPMKTKSQAKPRSNNTVKKVSGSVKVNKSTDIQKKIATGRRSTAAGQTMSAPSVGATHTKARPSTNMTQQKPKVTIHNPAPTPRMDHPTLQATLKKRISSVHKAPFQPHKSTKPPTRANFELPGDAFARKLKEQREERSKREEEDVPKPRVFKARPVRMSHAPEVRLTAATKARLSMAHGEPLNARKPSNGVTKPRTVTRPSATATASQPKRLSTLSVAKRSTQLTANSSKQPSGSARLTRGPSLNALTTARAPSALGANRPSLTAEENAQQKLKGKEVFGRTRVEIMEREKAKKEKEDAARKARADAAERGRIASREWAEKRKLEAGKLSEQGKAVEA